MPSTVTGQTIRLLLIGQPVPATVSRSSDGLSAELVPSQPLLPGTRYSIAISTELRDLAGDQLEQEFTSDLTTLATQLVGEIAFESIRNGRRWEIYLMKTDGSNISQLTDSVDGGGHAQGPSIPPNGRQVAFSAWVEGGTGDFEIYTINVDGTGLRNLTQSPAFEGVRPSWSPDGSQLAFWGNRDDPLNEDIYVMNADGTGVTRLTTDPDKDRWPAWSPDGSKIAFDRRVVGNHAEIYVMDADGTNLVRLTNEPGVDSGPGWSRDGTRIAFASDRDGVTAIWVMNADGTGLMKLTGDACCDFLPSWSP